MSKLKTALAGIDRHCIEGQDLNDQALDNEITHKAALAATRKALQGVRAHLDAAFEELKKPSPDDDQELAWSKVRRSSALEKLDRAHIGRINRIGNVVNRATPLPPAARGGGAHLTASVLEGELARLRSLW